jgi:hypothetical protein
MSLSNATYNVLTDFTLVSMTARFEMLPGQGGFAQDLADVVAAARAGSGSSARGVNPGSTQNLSAHLLNR